MAKYGYASAEHALNAQAKTQRQRSKNSPVKQLTGEELKAFAASRNMEVSEKHVPPQQKVAATTSEVKINVDALPAHLRKFVK